MAQKLSNLEAIYEYMLDAHILNVITSFPDFYSSSPTHSPLVRFHRIHLRRRQKALKESRPLLLQSLTEMDTLRHRFRHSMSLPVCSGGCLQNQIMPP